MDESTETKPTLEVWVEDTDFLEIKEEKEVDDPQYFEIVKMEADDETLADEQPVQQSDEETNDVIVEADDDEILAEGQLNELNSRKRECRKRTTLQKTRNSISYYPPSLSQRDKQFMNHRKSVLSSSIRRKDLQSDIQFKRERESNWTSYEKELFRTYVQEHLEIIQDRGNDSTMVNKKHEAWEIIRKKMCVAGFSRPQKKLREAWHRLKMDTSKTVANRKKALRVNGNYVRESNWSSYEKELFRTYAQEHLEIIQDRGNDSTMINKKIEAWEEIRQKMFAAGFSRPLKKLREAWHRLKVDASKTVANKTQKVSEHTVTLPVRTDEQEDIACTMLAESTMSTINSNSDENINDREMGEIQTDKESQKMGDNLLTELNSHSLPQQRKASTNNIMSESSNQIELEILQSHEFVNLKKELLSLQIENEKQKLVHTNMLIEKDRIIKDLQIKKLKKELDGPVIKDVS